MRVWLCIDSINLQRPHLWPSVPPAGPRPAQLESHPSPCISHTSSPWVSSSSRMCLESRVCTVRGIMFCYVAWLLSSGTGGCVEEVGEAPPFLGRSASLQTKPETKMQRRAGVWAAPAATAPAASPRSWSKVGGGSQHIGKARQLEMQLPSTPMHRVWGPTAASTGTCLRQRFSKKLALKSLCTSSCSAKACKQEAGLGLLGLAPLSSSAAAQCLPSTDAHPCLALLCRWDCEKGQQVGWQLEDGVALLEVLGGKCQP